MDASNSPAVQSSTSGSKPAPAPQSPRPPPKPTDAELTRALASGDKPCGYGGGYCTVT